MIFYTLFQFHNKCQSESHLTIDIWIIATAVGCILEQLPGERLYPQELVMVAEQGGAVVLVENDVISLLGLVVRTIIGIELMVHIDALKLNRELSDNLEPVKHNVLHGLHDVKLSARFLRGGVVAIRLIEFSGGTLQTSQGDKRI